MKLVNQTSCWSLLLISIFRSSLEDTKFEFRLPWWLSSKESACKAGTEGYEGSCAGLGRSPGGRHGSPLQYSCLENALDRGPGGLQSHGVTKIRTRLKWLSMHTHKSEFCQCYTLYLEREESMKLLFPRISAPYKAGTMRKIPQV